VEVRGCTGSQYDASAEAVVKEETMSYSNGDYYDAILVELEYSFGADRVDELYEKYDNLILHAVMDTMRCVDSPMKVSATVVNDIREMERTKNV